MKGIKTILGAAAVAALFTFSFSASAQENNNRDENGKVVRGAYETNGFWDNWFIGVGGGVNTAVTARKNLSDNIGKIGIATDVNVGKWFTPTVGARIAWRGLNNEIKGSGYQYGNDKFSQNFFHADFLWNLSNSFGGYKETRFWDIIPYFQTGVVRFADNDYAANKSNMHFGAGFGIINDFRLGKHVDLFLDLSAITVKKSAVFNGGGRLFLLPSATAGLLFNLGKTNWDRHSSITPVVIPVPFTVDQYNALKDKVAALEKENASLKNKIAALEAEKANAKKYVEGQNYVYKNGKFVETDATISTPASLYFDLGKATLSERELAHLEFFAQNALKDAGKVVVTGSADSKTGSAKYNQTLSEKRANYVKDILVKKYGIAADKISAKGIGGQASFNTPAKNRIVTVEVK